MTSAASDVTSTCSVAICSAGESTLLASRMSSTISIAVGLFRDEAQQLAEHVASDDDVLAVQRLCGAVDGRERSAKLVRHGGDEVRLELLESMVLGQVTECVHGSLGEADAADRKPDLAPTEVDGNRRRPAA